MKTVPTRASLTYRCPTCGFECVRKVGLASGLPVTKIGNYGASGGPLPTTYEISDVHEYTVPAGNNAFVAASGSDLAYLYDPTQQVSLRRIIGGETITVSTTSGTNDGTYVLDEKGVALDKLLLASGYDFTTEDGGAAGTITLGVVSYKPNVTTGCPFCGSLNTRKQQRR